MTLSDVAPQEVEWLWLGRLAIGKLNLIIGDPGLGKSSVTLDIAARISSGRPWPDGSPGIGAADVILMGAEDGLADTVRPRLDIFGADAGRVHALQGVRDGAGEREGLSLAADLDVLEQALESTGARTAVVDPISAYLGTGTDSHKDADVRAILAPVAALAERRNVALLGVMHLSKGEQRRAIHRALGSVGFVAAARVVLALGRDQEDDSHRLLMPVKNNLGPPAATLGFSFGANGALLWDAAPMAGVDVESVLGGAGPQGEEERGARGQAGAFLEAELADGPRPSLEVQAAARAEGIAPRTLARAQRAVGVKATREGFGKSGKWYWSLSEPKAATGSQDGQT